MTGLQPRLSNALMVDAIIMEKRTSRDGNV